MDVLVCSCVGLSESFSLWQLADLVCLVSLHHHTKVFKITVFLTHHSKHGRWHQQMVIHWNSLSTSSLPTHSPFTNSSFWVVFIHCIASIMDDKYKNSLFLITTMMSMVYLSLSQKKPMCDASSPVLKPQVSIVYLAVFHSQFVKI